VIRKGLFGLLRAPSYYKSSSTPIAPNCVSALLNLRTPGVMMRSYWTSSTMQVRKMEWPVLARAFEMRRCSKRAILCKYRGLLSCDITVGIPALIPSFCQDISGVKMPLALPDPAKVTVLTRPIASSDGNEWHDIDTRSRTIVFTKGF
jgi:hypothetical protein